MTVKMGGVPITGFMTTTDDVDVYPTHLDNLGKGGIHSVQDLTQRDAITPERRSEGMLCYILDDFALYQLSGGITNDDWLLIFTIIDHEVVLNNDLPKNYIYHGDSNNKTVESPILLDVRLDLLRIKAANFILGRPNEKLLSAQVLSSLLDGYMYNNGGTVTIKTSIPSGDLTLSEGKVFRGDSDNMAAEVQRLELDNLPTFSSLDPTKLLGVYNLYTGSSSPLSLGQPTITLAVQQCNLANLTVGKIWFGAAITPLEDPLNFGFNRPKEVDILPTDFLKVPFNKVILGNVFDRASAHDRIELQNMAKLTHNYYWAGNSSGVPEEVSFIPATVLEVPYKKVIIGDITDRASFHDRIELENMSRLTFLNIWRGNILGEPEETGDLTLLEIEHTILEGEVIVLQGEMIAAQAELLLHAAAIALLQIQVASALAAIAGLSLDSIPVLGDVSIHGFKIINLADPVFSMDAVNLQTLNANITALRLNNILADNHVSFYGFKIIDLANPTNPTDGVNLQTLSSTIAALRLNNILADNDVSLYGYKLTNLANPISSTDGVNLQTLIDYRPYIHIYTDGNLLATALVANIFSKVVCVTTANNSYLFTMTGNNTVTYIGLKPLVMDVKVNISALATSNKKTIGVSIYKNGVLVNGSKSYSISDKDVNVNITCFALVSLTTNDYLEVFISSDLTENTVIGNMSVIVTAA